MYESVDLYWGVWQMLVGHVGVGHLCEGEIYLVKLNFSSPMINCVDKK